MCLFEIVIGLLDVSGAVTSTVTASISELFSQHE
jgi:hypothetical protein